MKNQLPVRDILDRLGHAVLNLKNAGDTSAASHIQYAIELILEMARAEEESIEPEDTDGR